MTDYIIEPFEIGRASFCSNLVMAPVAGTTAAPFRSLCRHFGAGLTVGELTSAAGIIYDADWQKNRRYLTVADDPSADCVQLFGADPKQMADAVRRLRQHPEYGKYALIDINMGCPVPKVMKTGAGAALMGKPVLAAEMVKRVVQAADGVPVTAKIRSGLDEAQINAPELARMLEAAGASAITVHARTAVQRYSGKADLDVIGRVRESIRIPLIGSGDLAVTADLARMKDAAGVDAFMIGRAAIGMPWIFSELRGQAVSEAKKGQALITLVNGMVQLLGERTALAELRTQLGAAVRGRKDASVCRQRLFGADSAAELMRQIEACFG
ncbi:MAG TPA: tRNA dihydrouridine synthase DusB [Clostridiaceae bacterium]|nr:tRNA dihydrouridine synthase DusB [Clostridiaceae bacterium]